MTGVQDFVDVTRAAARAQPQPQPAASYLTPPDEPQSSPKTPGARPSCGLPLVRRHLPPQAARRRANATLAARFGLEPVDLAAPLMMLKQKADFKPEQLAMNGAFVAGLGALAVKAYKDSK